MLRPLGLWRPPAWVVDFMAAHALPACDAAAVSDRHSGALALDAYRESWRQSANGVFADAEIYIAPWGFALNEITVPVRLWHGGEDANFAPFFAEALARELPGCTFRLVPGEGHYSLPMRRAREIVADLLSVAPTGLPSPA
jgi:pimeloyl-ACP methyl ester carboxylesterase